MVGRACLIVVALLVGLTVGTEVFAYLTRLAPELGPPLYRQGWLVFYGPWRGVVWAWQWLGVIPQAFILPGFGLAFGTALALVCGWPRPRQAPKVQAHWATTQELKQAECLSTSGVVLGRVP